MRIAVFAGTFPKQSETFVFEPVIEMLGRGIDVHVFAREKTSDGSIVLTDQQRMMLDGRVHYGAESLKHSALWQVFKLVLRVACLCVRDFKAAFRIVTLIVCCSKDFTIPAALTASLVARCGRFDVFHAHFLDNAFAAQYANLFFDLNVPVVVTCHGVDVNVAGGLRRASRVNGLFSSKARYTTNTEFTKTKAIELGCDGRKIKIIPAPVRFDDIEFKRRNFPDGGLVELLLVGRLVEKKGIEFLLRALPNVLNHVNNLHLHIAGGGPLEGSLRRLANELGVMRHVTFHGWCNRSEVLDLYSRSHVFILPSVTATNGDREGQGVVLQEAQAAGLPVISTLHNGIPDGVLDGISGVLVPERDVEALSKALCGLLDSHEDWGKMGQAGSDFVRDGYGLKMVVDRQLEYFCEVMDLA